jgi:UDP-N-acetylglucosamine 2-epimerase (non-hydrolysing)
MRLSGPKREEGEVGLKVVLIVGARPNFIKMGPILRAMKRSPGCFEPFLVHTGQHYDREMAGIFFDDLHLPRPDVELGIGQGSPTEQTARIMLGLDPLLDTVRPDWMVVVGDVNSTLAAALVAAKRGVALAHVEAGLRSFDRRMPEEMNRIVVDQLADLLLTPSPDANENLRREGIAEERIVEVGNVMIDSLVATLQETQLPKNRQLREEHPDLPHGTYGVVTLHRAANVDDPHRLAALLGALGRVARRLPLLFPVHPRTAARMDQFQLCFPEGVTPLPPLGYRRFLDLWRNAVLVLTDSGGLQEETTALGVPCFTLRETTERPVTIEYGTNRLVGTDPDHIVAAVWHLLDRDEPLDPLPPPSRLPLWDGRAAERIVSTLLDRSGGLKG